ncbi:Fet3 protein [Auriculariales sp. MPI-PUGE-AT-0066]|nr:Fet3 protein [Auriculariales sp. MPI-PUGE-AT-0066]
MATNALVAVAALALAPLTAVAATVELWWNITYVDGVNPDGLFARRAIGVNGTWPPPPIRTTVNDTLILHAHNGLGDQPASVHHHGMFFNATSWYDGATMVTQCGIPPGATFDYVVPISESGQRGTYWAHSHKKGQYVDGLRTPFTISAGDADVHKAKYDDEFTVVLGDWYHDQQQVLIKQFLSIANPGGAEPVPDSSLIYFVHDSDTSYLPPIEGTTSGSNNVGFNENATLPFEAGKTYRLRVVNTSAFAMFFFWIDGHDMRIIEVDGTDVEEYPTDLLTLTVAQRYSVLVTARNDTASNWAVHANMDTDMFDTVPDALNPNITSSVTYSKGAQITDSGFIDAYHDINDTAIVPVTVEPQLPPATTTIELEVTFDTMDNGVNRAMFNTVTYNFPNVPAVLSALSLGSNATIAEAYGPNSFVVNHMDIVDIVLKNGDAGKHPFHLHGHKFQIIHRAEDYTSDDPALNPPLVEGQQNPIRRDTVQVPSGHSATMRLVADNPGVWLFHCHIEWHLEAGLVIQLIEAPLEMQAAAQNNHGPPQFIKDHCAAQNIPTTGNAAGHTDDPRDLSGLTMGPYPQVLGWRPKGIGAMFACVFTAVLGMATVVWYALTGTRLDEAEVERRERERLDNKKGFAFWKKRE